MNNQVQMKAGDQFGRMTVLNPDIKRHRALCLCQCGNEKIVLRSNLKRGNTTSCGCFQKEQTAAAHYIHGKTNSKAFNSWKCMLSRCYYKKDVAFSRYGGKGVRVCDRWNKRMGGSFVNFLADMGEPPTNEHTLDKDKLGDGMLYSPETCCWLTPAEQCKYRKNAIWLTHQGESMHILDWVEQTGLSYSLIADRKRSGWSDERALTTPVQSNQLEDQQLSIWSASP